MILAVSGFEDLPAAIRRYGEGRRLLAFDVFNTLVRRQVEGEWLKRASAFALRRALARRVHHHFLPSYQSIFERRKQLELEVVRERVARGEDNESDFSEVARRWVGTWVPRDNEHLVSGCIEQELLLEENALTATPNIQQALTAAREIGARVIFVSDMYLSAAQVGRLLRKCGLGGFFDGGYTSHDAGRRKATGKIFPWLLDRESVAASDVLFVGDDLEADQIQPARVGIDSVHVVDVPELQRRDRLKALEGLAAKNHAWNEALVDELITRLPARATRADQGVDYRLGLALAPGLVAYVMDAVDLALRRDIKHVFFLAREGLTFLRIFARLKKAGVFDDGAPQVRYLHVSRASTILASMKGLTWEDLSRFWRQYPNQTLVSLLKNLSLPPRPFVEAAASVGLSDPNRRLRPPAEDPEFQRFLESREVHRAFAAARTQARALLRDYLVRKGLWGQERVLLADIGWKGSMQDNLARAFSDQQGFPELFGAYLALASEGEVYPRSFKHGFLADYRRGNTDERDLYRNTAIFEMVTQAAHGSTIGYERRAENQRVVVPVLKEYEIERENAQQYFRASRAAIDDWTTDFCRVFDLSPFSGDELRAGALARALDYIRYPSRQEAEAFLRYSHVESFGVHHVSRFGFDVSLRDLVSQSPRATWRELQRRFEHTMWREGVIKRSRLPLGTFLWDLWTTLKQTR